MQIICAPHKINKIVFHKKYFALVNMWSCQSCVSYWQILYSFQSYIRCALCSLKWGPSSQALRGCTHPNLGFQADSLHLTVCQRVLLVVHHQNTVLPLPMPYCAYDGMPYSLFIILEIILVANSSFSSSYCLSNFLYRGWIKNTQKSFERALLLSGCCSTCGSAAKLHSFLSSSSFLNFLGYLSVRGFTLFFGGWLTKSSATY